MDKFRWTPRIALAGVIALTSCSPAASREPSVAPPAYNVNQFGGQIITGTATQIPPEDLDGATFVARMERVNLYYVHRYGFTCFVAIGPQPIALSCTPDEK